MPCQDAALDRLVSVSDRRKARVRAYRAHHNNHLPKIRSAVPLEIVHVEVDGRLRDGHQIVSAQYNRQPMLLTEENIYQVDLQGRQIVRDELAIHDLEISHT